MKVKRISELEKELKAVKAERDHYKAILVKLISTVIGLSNIIIPDDTMKKLKD